MGSSIFIRGKKTKSRFLNTQKPFFEHEIMQNAIWNMEKLKKVWKCDEKNVRLWLKSHFFASTEPLFNFTIMQNGHKINSSKQCWINLKSQIWLWQLHKKEAACEDDTRAKCSKCSRPEMRQSRKTRNL